MNPTDDPAAFRSLYDGLDAPVTARDCGQMCAPHNPSAKPFCCDIQHAAPAAYHAEWVYLQESTDLWRPYEGEAGSAASGETPAHMRLLACKGPAHCQRPFRALSCRQFPFFPYITSGGQFIGLAYDWEFEPVCWVISNLGQVTAEFRESFVRTYDALLADWGEDFKSYYLRSEQMREVFAARRRRIPLLHRRGGYYRVSPHSERLRKVAVGELPKFGFYARPSST